MDKRVEIHGTTRADINGKHGVATDFHFYREERTKDRYTVQLDSCLLYTSPSPRDKRQSRMPSSA